MRPQRQTSIDRRPSARLLVRPLGAGPPRRLPTSSPPDSQIERTKAQRPSSMRGPAASRDRVGGRSIDRTSARPEGAPTARCDPERSHRLAVPPESRAGRSDRQDRPPLVPCRDSRAGRAGEEEDRILLVRPARAAWPQPACGTTTVVHGENPSARCATLPMAVPGKAPGARRPTTRRSARCP